MDGPALFDEYDELNWMPGTPEGSLESQTMEMDADFNATRLIMQTIDRLWEEHATLPPPPMNEYYADRAKAVYDAGAAICIMCRMFGDRSISGVDLSKSQHPPRWWRQMSGEDLLQPTRTGAARVERPRQPQQHEDADGDGRS